MIQSALSRAHDQHYDPDRYFAARQRVQPRCARCSAFLPFEPQASESIEHGEDCDGTERFVPQGYSEEAIAILGESYRNKTYMLSVSTCEVERGPHDPHRILHWIDTVLISTCRRCNHVNRYVE